MKDHATQTRRQPYTEETLARENLQFSGSRGVSANNHEQGFIPAFLDTETGVVYRSRFPDGRPAPVHVLSGLPAELIDTSNPSNGQRAIKNSVVSGFIREDSFYSREEAASSVVHCQMH